MRPTFPRPLQLVGGLAFGLAACGGPSATIAPSATVEPSATIRPSPTPVVGEAPSPTPIGVVVGSPFDAWTLVLPQNPLFAGAAPRTEDAVGQSQFWVATPLGDGGFRIDVTIGWGDCPAGCIDRHVWSYEVSPDGRVELIGETGPEVPPDIR
jgi:hypothetical protein